MKYKITIVALLLFICILLSAGFPRPVGHINDFVGVLDTSTRVHLNNIFKEIQQLTTVEMAIAIIPNTGDLDIETYANLLFENWGIGNRYDEGVLILLATEQREIRVEVGYGSEGYLTDGTAGALLDQYVIPFLRRDDFAAGARNAVYAFARHIIQAKDVELAGQQPAAQEPPVEYSPIPGLVILGIFLLLVIATRGRIIPWLLLAMASGRRRGGRGGMSGGGFGGFGGGRSGGGGATRRF